VTEHAWGLVRVHADRWISTVKEAPTGNRYTALVGQSGILRWTAECSTIQEATQAADAQLVELGHHCSTQCQGWVKAQVET
jgi:hypothetical protein